MNHLQFSQIHLDPSESPQELVYVGVSYIYEC